MAQQAQKHSDVFGGGDFEDEYADMEDSFMWGINQLDSYLSLQGNTAMLE
jgi:hypothetical protein